MKVSRATARMARRLASPRALSEGAETGGAESRGIRFSLTIPYGFLFDHRQQSRQIMTVRYGQIKAVVPHDRRGRASTLMSDRKSRLASRLATATLAASIVALAACADLPGPGAKPQPKAIETYADQQSFAAPTADW